MRRTPDALAAIFVCMKQIEVGAPESDAPNLATSLGRRSERSCVKLRGSTLTLRPTTASNAMLLCVASVSLYPRDAAQSRGPLAHLGLWRSRSIRYPQYGILTPALKPTTRPKAAGHGRCGLPGANADAGAI